MTLRKTILYLHLTLGCVAGAVIFIMSATGVLLAYERQITNWAERGYRHEPAAGAVRLPMDDVVAAASAIAGSAPSSVLWRNDPAAAVEVGFGRDRTLFVNPYTAQILGEGAKSVRAFFQHVEDWHRWLAMSGASRATAKAVTGACNLMFFALVCSGLFLWWPRNGWANGVRWFSRKLSGRARDFNWHNTIGFWCCVPLFVVVFCSVVMSYQWANSLVYRATGNEPPKPQLRGEVVVRGERKQHGSEESTWMEPLRLKAEQRVMEWKTITLRMAPGEEKTAAFTIDSGDGGRPDKRAQLTLDRASGAEMRWEPFAGYNSGRKLRTWIRFTHTGEAGGVIGETIAAVASLGACFLVWTGIALSIRRFRAWMGRRKAAVG